MYLIAASASELLEWCDVPRTKENYMAGYQRGLKEGRAADITEYLRTSPKNILPGAIVVATDEEYVKPLEVDGELFLEVSEDNRDFQTKLLELWGSFTSRLSAEELASADIQFSESDIDTEDYDESEEPASYLALLAQELNRYIQDPESLDEERKQAIHNYIDGVSKPGLIIDGQHRVIGAKNVSAHDVYLPVVVMHGLRHEEQVFQFYVLNSKAKPLTPTELRRIISTSLTNSEIADLFIRFHTAGVDANEARWTYEMNTSSDSVFKGLIDFGFKNAGEVIPENVADQLVKAFMKMPRNRYASLTDPVEDRWKDSRERLSIFFDFWRAISIAYAPAWEDAVKKAREGQKPQLFSKVALLTLQRFLLDRFVTALPYRSKSALPPFANKETTQEMVESTLENLPGKFFTQPWKLKQMDTQQGRQILYDEMSKAWENQGKNIGNQKLFRG